MDLFARDKQFWRLVGSAAVVGTFGALGALAFTTVVREGTQLIWPEEIDYGFLGGEPWWIGVTTLAGIIVSLARRWLRVPDQPIGSLAMVQEARIDLRTALQTIVVSAISLIGGASLGPFDGGTRSGAAAGSWFSSRVGSSEDEGRVNTLSGISGALGGLLTAPVLATLFVTELRRPDPAQYYRVLIPNLTGAVFGFIVYFSVVGDTFLGVFSVPGYDVQPWHFAIAAGLGLLAAAVSWVLGLTVLATRHVMVKYLPHPVLRAAVGGLGVGLIGVALPLTLASGKAQLTVASSNIGEIGAGLLALVVLGKILAMALSLASGFIGGPVMPTLFIGGTTGIAVHLLVPELPLALTFSCLLVAVPGTSVKAPFTMVLLAGLTVGVGPADGAPAGVAVITAYLVTAGLGLFGISTASSEEPAEEVPASFREELLEITDASSSPPEDAD